MALLAFLVLLPLFPVHAKAGVWPFSGCGGDNAQKLEQEIRDEHNPVKKAKCQTALARLKLKEGVRAYNKKNFELGEKLLAEYVDVSGDAWKVLKNSGRNAVKSPAGFKDLEIALRENDRLLKDLAHRVPYTESKAIEEAEKRSMAIHDEVVDALFPSLRLHEHKAAAKPAKHSKSKPSARGPG